MTSWLQEARNLLTVLAVAFAFWTFPSSGGAQTTPDAIPDPGGKSETSLSAWAEAYLNQFTGSSPRDEETLDVRLERLRAMYFLSVDDGDWSKIALDSLRSIRSGLPAGNGALVTLEAYRGSLEVVRAKHARWPPNKLKHLKRGSGILDGLVEDHPDDLELRYLRYASYRFLPVFLKRDEAVASDRRVLVEGLPNQPDRFSRPFYRGMLRFVLDNAELLQAESDRLEAALNG